MSQQRYWLLMIQTRMSIAYIMLNIRHAEKWEKRFSGFLALTSSTSIAGWVLWNHIPMLWASIIAVSHVVTTLKPYFPFAPRLKTLPRLLSRLEDIFLDLERDWHDIAAGNLTEKKIHEKLIAMKGRLTKAERDSLGELIIPTNPTFAAIAEESTNKYFKDNYH